MVIALVNAMQNIPPWPPLRRIMALAAALPIFSYGLLAEARENGSKTVLALDLDYAAPRSEPDSAGGGGGALRIGRKFDLIALSLTPEIGGSYAGFGGNSSATVYRGFIGGRLGIGKIFEPSAFAHIGLGELSSSNTSHIAPTFDAGVAFDFTLLPLIDLGAHASYNTLVGQGVNSAFDWFLLGVHVALEF